jgi:Rps23 Pro-64 3,4-dihydroxylase Tpa1-like proline 4-hydroxylase
MSESSLDPVVFEINPKLDPSRLNQAYQVNGRLHVPDFLNLAGAQALHQHLAEEIEWSYFLFNNKHLWEVSAETRRQYDTEQETALTDLAYSAGKEGYAFIYETNQLTTRDASGATKRTQHSSLIKSFVDFLHSESFMEFARRLTGASDIRSAEATATCFRPGHFLAFHDDSAASSRRIAYVVNLAQSWRPEWGGLLEFMSPEGHIAEAYVPRFNSLNVFSVPQAHAVSCVSPFAPTPRFAISGWLHARPGEARGA